MPEPLRVALLTAGTRGDVQPFAALAGGLRRAGCEVTLAAPVNMEPLARAHGVPFSPIRVDFQAFASSPEGRAMMANPLNAARVWRSTILPLVRSTLDDAWAAARDVGGRGADAIVYHPKILGAVDMAEKLGARAFAFGLAPFIVPTAAFPSALVARRSLGPWLNRWTYELSGGATRLFGRVLRAFRAETLGLPRDGRLDAYAVRGVPVPVLHAYSEHLAPPAPDWPARAHVTGFWFLDDDASGEPEAPPALRAFLEAGEPPVYVGFGSIAGRDPRATTRAVLDALRLAGVRAVVASGWGGLSADEIGTAGLASDRVCAVGEVSHAWLLPRVAAVVHHGGAGTTGAGLRAGRATVVCPFFGDQPYWGARVAAVGAGPPPIPQRRLTAERLAAALRVVTSDRAMQARAAALGQRIRAEEGVGRAVGIVTGAARTD